MRMRRLGVAITLTAKELVRRRVVVLMLLVVPTVFYGVILAITTTKPIDFQLAAIEEEDYVRVAQRDEALVFIGLAAVGVLTAFLGLNLAQRDFEACRRLVVCGYRPWELALSRLAVLVGVVFGVSVLAVAVLPLFFSVGHIVMVAAGFALCGWVYGCYGLAVGAFLRQELEGVLFVALLANLDIGWLQNPIYYAHAQNQAVIRSLPGFLPSQVAMAAAFSEHDLSALIPPLIAGFGYGGLLLAVALGAVAWRMRVTVSPGKTPRPWWGQAPARKGDARA